MKSILFVCHGNICRSPMAEYIFKYISNNRFIVSSSATSAEEIGNDMHKKTKKKLLENNIPFDRHCAKQITIEEYNKYDIIVCFDENNLNNLKRMLPNSSKVIKLLENDIDDPWYTGNFDKTYNDIYKGCIKLLNKIIDE